MFNLGLREELKEHSVSVTTLMPGATDSDFHTRAGMNNTAFGLEPLRTRDHNRYREVDHPEVGLEVSEDFGLLRRTEAGEFPQLWYAA
ncbi:hypothetical protein ACIBJC_02525 [Streptomyces sp. NPDC050509]|uniref:hypothetical protein n=1 Tax=Streptomyces sp. NPDC050509 TaxID=3365620 RepID=UPI003799F358